MNHEYHVMITLRNGDRETLMREPNQEVAQAFADGYNYNRTRDEAYIIIVSWEE